MGKRPIQIFLVFTISSLLLLGPSYLRNSSVLETTSIFMELNLDSLDQGDKLDDQQHESSPFLSSLSPSLFIMKTKLFGRSYLLAHQITFHFQTESILRC